ncbi:hypothetical protein Q428_00265 [Fervidicella metallireducens AeB]|uniref:Carboxypeptidase Q n=1 Tax=Fervidicella metallireducens AeB TaxID=1403537 RepID=A0A017RZN7_9CLOT|nr:M28 family peptidase [Fervidicella metallireducens]EYE89864.1 hypothetical protein Q428_00265 [Fervidicella metallireducens AeB]
MKKIFLFLSLIVFSTLNLLITSQNLVFARLNKSDLSSIKFKDFSKNISKDRMFEHIKYLANTDNARITGTDGEKRASSYIKNEFQKLGLTVEEQFFPVIRYKCSQTKVTLISPEKEDIYSCALTYSAPTPPEGITAEVCYIDAGTTKDFQEADIKGKLVLIKRNRNYFDSKILYAYKYGAVGIIFYDPETSCTFDAELYGPSKIPALSISEPDASYIKNLLFSNKKVKINIKVISETTIKNSSNIIATKKANLNSTDTKTLIIGAHYDGVNTPAANDNASGIAVLLETAGILSKENLNCNIKFIAFGAEEIGLKGSTYYVSKLTTRDINNIISMINIDMAGVGNTLYLHTLNSLNPSFVADISEECIKRSGYNYTIFDQDSSDHVPFENAGIPFVYFEYGPCDNYHTDNDVPSKISKNNLFNVCNVVTKVAFEICSNPKKYLNIQR